MKILQLVHDYLPEHAGGAEVHAHRLGRELVRRGHAVTALFCERDPARREGQLRAGRLDGVRTLELVHQREYADLTETWLQPAARRAFEQVLAAERPEVVHAHHLGPWGPGCLAAARAAGCAVVFTAHDLHAICDEGRLLRADGSICKTPAACVDCLRRHRAGPLDLARAAELRRRAFRSELAEVDALIAPSRFLAARLSEFGLPSERIEVLAPGVEGPVRTEARPAGDPRAPLRVGFVGGLYPAKGAHVLIEALGLLAREGGWGVELSLHGVLEWFPAYVAELRAAAAGLPPRFPVRFMGRFAPDEVDRVLAPLEVLVVPSLWYENAPLVVADAWRQRLPVVASDHGGLAELVRHGVDGLCFRPGDAADLARALDRLARDRALLARLSAATPRPPSVAAVAARLETVYAGAAGP